MYSVVENVLSFFQVVNAFAGESSAGSICKCWLVAIAIMGSTLCPLLGTAECSDLLCTLGICDE